MQEQTLTQKRDLNILLLEDYQLDAELMTRELLSAHPRWNITHVADRQQFVDALKKQKPDCVISDFAMPQYSGMEAFFTVKELGMEIPFIIVTGELPEDVAIKCISDGIDDYVIKSSLKRLGVTIQKAVDKKRIEFKNIQITDDLWRSDNQYKNIFNNMGVAICEFTIPGIHEIQKRYAENDQIWNDASLVQLQKILSEMKLRLANDEMISLFEAQEVGEFKTQFLKIFPDKSFDLLRVILNGLSARKAKLSIQGEFLTFKGNGLHLKCKIICISDSQCRYIASWIDLTDTYKSENRLNKVLNRLEHNVTMRTRELSSANNQLMIEARDKQKMTDILKENYIQMTDSIIVAKKIQQLMLPSKQSIADTFDDTFVYLRPRDIVSGDFYWFYRNGQKCWMAAVDCTGHGVPGAFMSMIGSKILNQIVMKEQTMSTSEILKEIDSYVIREFKQHESGTEISTGMDISLCSFDFETSMLRYSGAYQSLFMVRDKELTEYKGERFSLGGTFKHKNKEFTEYQIQIKKGDSLYMLTDGFVDQFGGPKNKKFTRKRLMSLLMEVQGKSMYDQEMAIKSSLQDWKGTYEQVDDILVMGVKI